MYIVSVAVQDREHDAMKLQNLFTEYGEKINTRLGIHNPQNKNNCVIIISYIGEDVEKFVEDLNMISGTDVNFMLV